MAKYSHKTTEKPCKDHMRNIDPSSSNIDKTSETRKWKPKAYIVFDKDERSKSMLQSRQNAKTSNDISEWFRKDTPIKRDIPKPKEIPQRKCVHHKIDVEVRKDIPQRKDGFQRIDIQQRKELSQRKEVQQPNDIPQRIEIPQRKELSQRKEVTQQKDIPQRIEIPQRKEVSQRKEVPQPKDIPQRIEIPQRKEVSQRKEVTQPKDIPQRIEIPQREELSQRKEVPQPKDIPKRKEITQRKELLQRKEVPQPKDIPKRKEITQRKDVPQEYPLPEDEIERFKETKQREAEIRQDIMNIIQQKLTDVKESDIKSRGAKRQRKNGNEDNDDEYKAKRVMTRNNNEVQVNGSRHEDFSVKVQNHRVAKGNKRKSADDDVDINAKRAKINFQLAQEDPSIATTNNNAMSEVPSCPETCVCKVGPSSKPTPIARQGYTPGKSLYHKLLQRRLLNTVNMVLYECCEKKCCEEWCKHRIPAAMFEVGFDKSDLRVNVFPWGQCKQKQETRDTDYDWFW